MLEFQTTVGLDSLFASDQLSAGLGKYGCKVCRVLDQRDLEGYDEHMLSAWRGDGPNRNGYRELARWLNVTLLRREMDEVGLSTLGGEADSKYERLQNDHSVTTCSVLTQAHCLSRSTGS